MKRMKGYLENILFYSLLIAVFLNSPSTFGFAVDDVKESPSDPSLIVEALENEFFANDGTGTVPEGTYFGAYIITVDGLSSKQFWPGAEVSRKNYLIRAVKSLFPSTSHNAIPDSHVENFYWNGDANSTDIYVPALATKLATYASLAQSQDKKLIVVSHSWGTVLSFLALHKSGVYCDLFITLSTPLALLYPVLEPTPCPPEDDLVRTYTFAWMTGLGCSQASSCGTGVERWANFYAWGDHVSGPLKPLVFSESWITDEDVQGLGWLYDPSCLTRNLNTTKSWHGYTTLLEDYVNEFDCPEDNVNPSNYFLRNRVKELIRQHSASIEIVLPSPPSVLQAVTFEGHGWIGSTANEAIEWEWDFAYDGTVFDTEKIGSSVTHPFEKTGKHTIALRSSTPGAVPIVVKKEIYVSQLPIEVGYPEGFESLKRNFSTPYSDMVSEYKWNFGDGTEEKIGREKSHEYETSDFYTVTLKINLNDGSTFTSKKGIFVGPGTRYIQGHTISGSETWSAGGTYVIEGNIYISRGGILTVESGVTIELSKGVSINVSGKLEANGATFTWSDGTNEWAGIRFYSTSSGSRLDGCTIEHASGLGSGVPGAVHLDKCSPTITGCTIQNCSADTGISAYVYSGFGEYTPTITNNSISGFSSRGIYVDSDTSPTITGNTLSENKYGIRVSYSSTDNNPIINSNTYTNNTDGDICVYGTIGTGVTWNDTGAYCIGDGGDLYISDGASLEIVSGTSVKFESGRSLSVSGTLEATNTTFTWADGTNEWAGIRFYSTSSGSRLDGCTIEHASGLGSGVPGAVHLDKCSPTITGCTIQNCSADTGISAYVYSGSGEYTPTITNNTISGFTSRGIYVDSEVSPTITGNTLSGNEYGIYAAGGGSYDGNTLNGNSLYGIYRAGSGTISAKNCNWGHITGPLDASDDRATGGLYNPSGQGDKVSDNVGYYPWADPTVGATAVPTGLSSTPGDGTINLEWNANAESYLGGYKIYHGTISGSYGNPVIVGKVTTHQLTGLTNGTPYYITISSMNTLGAESEKAPEITETPMDDQDAPTSNITNPSNGDEISGQTYTIRGTADDGEGTGVKQVEVSTDGGTTWTGASGTTTWNHVWSLPEPGTYTLKSRATDDAGNVEIPGAGVSVQVVAEANKPTAATAPATAVTTTSVTLHGTVNPNGDSTTVVFEWGADMTYGKEISASQSPLTGTTDQNVSASLTGLTPQTTYHYRVKAVNSHGTAYGGDLQFDTLTDSSSVVYVSPTDNTCGNNSPCYATIQEAINEASTGTVIKVCEGTYDGTPVLNQSKHITLNGCWNPSFTGQTPGKTRIKAPKAPLGSITLQMVTIKP